ncbi:MAG TPA: acyltransferase [Gammaproteobacteria bacterium]|nr:acyltransferase [Gammaproteobacteria bacterium]
MSSNNTKHDLVRPATAPAGTSSWPLTPIDRYAFQWVIQGTWVFDTPLDAGTLKHGLARLLDAYPILCGRAAGDRIHWRSGGVPFVEAADPRLGVADFGLTRVDAARLAERPSPALIRRGLAPLLAVKLTHLHDGCALAICCSHACLDGNGFYTMARNLSRAATGRPFDPPVLDRPPPHAQPRSRAAVARAAREAGWHRLGLLDAARFALARRGVHDRAFVARFSPAALERCKQTLAGASRVARLSTTSALLAHVAHCTAALLRLGRDDAFRVSFLVDQRERLAALPAAFARNAVSAACTGPIGARAPAEEIAARLHERLEPLLAKPSLELEALALLTAEVAAHYLPYSSIPLSGLPRRRPTLLYTNSFAKFPVYDLDFGEATRPLRPVRAIPHNLGDQIVVWPAPPASGGLELYFSGPLARAVARVSESDAWWAELRRFDEP